MRDRLVELLEAECGFSRYMTDDERRAKLADHLLANGVIVPPCKVGDKVYRTFGNYCGEKIFEGVVDQISIYNNREIRFWVYGHPLGFACHDIGKTVFLTREEAEKALAKMKDDEQKKETYFSPEDVRKMTQLEVRKNYKAIINSMKKWH